LHPLTHTDLFTYRCSQSFNGGISTHGGPPKLPGVRSGGWLDDAMEPTRAQIRSAPQVLLHDHLDGAGRPPAVRELANEIGHLLPTHESAEALGAWFAEAADSGSLVRYLETFDHTVAVMQSGPAITRIARECVEDLAADGVVYAEIR